MKLLIIGQGGREHALAWKVAQSPLVAEIWVAPGNAGTALEHKVKNCAIPVTAIADLISFAQQQSIDLTIVGPEAALAVGIVDAFTTAELACFGPTQAAARLESSKCFCKDFLRQHQIPTAQYASFTAVQPAVDYLRQQAMPIVIKADGLAAGKGVVIAQSLAEAEQAVHDMLSSQAFGQAGQHIVIEEFLAGYELSYIVMSDGVHILPLASSQDHKRLLDHDLGPNTGGMGAFSPAPQLTEALEQQILNTIIRPTLDGMAALGTPYIGFLYAGLMITPDQQVKVLEFNCRLGDPETQVILMRLRSDLVELCLAALNGQLDHTEAQWNQQTALTVVMAAGGYPYHSQPSEVIKGLSSINDSHCKVFHASSKQLGDNIVTDGGRVLAVTALGENLAAAQQNAYAATHKISWPNCQYRHDIGQRALEFVAAQEDIKRESL